MSKWYSKFAPWSSQSEVKSLKDKLENFADEARDNADAYEAKSIDAEPGSLSPMSGNFSGTDQQIDVAALQRIFTSETWVYGCVMALAETIAGLPIRLEKKTIVNKKVVNDEGVEETVQQEVWNDASGERLYRLFQYPNAYTTRAEFLMLLVIDLMTAGEYFIYLDAPEGVLMESGLPDESNANDPYTRLRQVLSANTPIKGMYRLPPAMIKPVQAENSLGVAGYEMTNAGGSFVFGYPEVIHVKLPNPTDSMNGLSPLVPAFKPVLIDRFSTEHMIRFYKSGARLGGVVETEKSLNKEQLARFQRTFENNYTGRQNHHRTLILPPGMKYKAVEQNPAESALLDFCKYNREAVMSAFKVPPIKLGLMDNANYANARVQLKTFFQDSIKPKLAFIEDGFNLKSAMMPDKGLFRVRFDLSGVEELQEDQEVKAKMGKAMLDAGMSVNEVRKEVWKKDVCEGGEVVPAVEAAKRAGGLMGAPGMLSSPPPSESKDPDPNGGGPGGLLAGMSGPQVTSIMNILGRVARGKIEKTSAVELLIGVYGFQPERAHKLVGLDYTPPAPVAKEINGEVTPPTSIKPTSGTFTDRVNELVGQMVQAGTPLALAIPKAMEQARLEGFTDEPSPVPAPPKALNEFLGTAISQLAADEPVTADLIAELTALFAQPKPDQKEGDIPAPAGHYQHGFTKERLGAHWKSFSEKTAPMISKREEEIRKFFKAFESIVLTRMGANLKAYGLHKARDNGDVDDILDEDSYDAAIRAYGIEVDKALMDAYKYGYSDTMVNVKIQKEPDAKAMEFLTEYGASEVRLISDTTRDQMKTLLSEAFAKGQSIGDISKAVREKFTEINQGRAVTIARTETLSAVSAGRESKREEIKAEYPDLKLKKIWVDSNDDRVRDSHAQVNGEVVGADEKFSNGLLYPRDPSGEASEIIQCRCDEITFAAEDQALIEESLTPADEGDGEKNLGEPDARKGAVCPVHGKGGPNSGCRGPNCGRPRSGIRPRDAYPERHPEPDNPHGAANLNGGDSREQHMEGGQYTMRRAMLHRMAVNEIKSHGEKTIPPIAVIMGGGSGSGKTTVLNEAMGRVKDEFATVNADDIKEKFIPEYLDMMKAGQADKAAAFTHEESSDIAKTALKEVIDDRRNLIYDSALSSTEKSTALIGKLKAAGYKVHVIYADLPVDEAVRRSDIRAKQTGRHVPHDVIIKAHQGAIETLGRIASLTDTLKIYNNQGETPTVSYLRNKTKVVVRDDKALADMSRRGHKIS